MMPWFGGFLLLVGAMVMGLQGPAESGGRPFLISFTILSAVYGLLYWRYRAVLEQGGSTKTLLWILFFGVTARLLIFPMDASDDVHRYLWEGRLQQLGGNPFVVSPAEGEAWVPAAVKPDRHRGLVNHPELTTIYPPGAQLLFLVASEVRYSVAAWKALMIVAELFLVWLLVRMLQIRGQSRARIWRYLWHPLPIVAFAGEGHLDVLLLAGIWGFFLGLVRSRPAWAGVSLSIAIMVKFLGALYLPIAVRRLRWPGMVLAAVLALALTLPFADSGFGLVRTLVSFGRDMSYNASWQPLVGAVLGPMAVRALGLAALATVAVLVVRRNRNPVRSGFFLSAAFLLASPTVHPWYLTLLVPFLVYRWRMWAAIWTCSVGWTYAAYAVEAQTGVFRLPLGWLVAEYLPVYLVLGYWGLKSWKRFQGEESVPRSA